MFVSVNNSLRRPLFYPLNYRAIIKDKVRFLNIKKSNIIKKVNNFQM